MDKSSFAPKWPTPDFALKLGAFADITQTKLLRQSVFTSLLKFCLNFVLCAIGVTTKEITNLAAETCAYMAIVHPDYTKLANRVTV